MDTTLIQRYQPGGDIYAAILSQHGQEAADSCAAAALTGDETAINAALTLYSGTSTPYQAVPLAETSTASILGEQLATDPLAAPLESANKVLNNTFLSFLKNPTVLIVLALVVFFVVFDGLNIIKGKLKS